MAKPGVEHKIQTLEAKLLNLSQSAAISEFLGSSSVNDNHPGKNK